MSKNVRKWLDEPSTYKPEEMRACLDSWREVLFNHLDQEVCSASHPISDSLRQIRTLMVLMALLYPLQVKDLGGENMKKFWTLEELERIPL